MIQLEHISKIYGDFRALEDVSLRIAAGEIFGVLGASGAGKSTLVRLINRLEIPTSGKVLIEGVDLALLPDSQLHALRRSIGMIFQGFHLMNNRTALSNVLFPLELEKMPSREAKARALELLERVGLSDKAGSYPSQLSGGQKQRVAIARALVNRPRILLLDEATSALDKETTSDLLDLLSGLQRDLGLTLVVITHEMDVVKEICQRVALIEKGRLVEVSDTLDFFSRQKFAPQAELEGSHRLLFKGPGALKPLLAQIIREYDVPVNILAGNIELIQGKSLGRLLVSLPRDEKLEEILRFLRTEGVEIEEVEHAAH